MATNCREKRGSQIKKSTSCKITGMAIRQNSAKAWNGNRDVALYQTKKGILAVLWHCTDFDSLAIRHQLCPRSKQSWCSYWQKDGKDAFALPGWNFTKFE